jgi:Cu-Zn family superoxide dismutase
MKLSSLGGDLMPIQMRTMIVALAWGLVLGSCGDGGRDTGARDADVADVPADAPGAVVQDSPAAPDAADPAVVPMRDAVGRDLGTLTLAASAGGITVTGRLTGLPPGEHAMHFHRVGRCEPPAFKSAADHWNPTNRRHGVESPQGPHLGDLPNITVAQDGSVMVQATTPGGALRGSDGLLDDDGAAVVVHAGWDDYRSQPSGDAGDPIACGVVAGPS